MPTNLRIDGGRLLQRLETLRLAGDTGDGGSRRLALSDTDKAGRDLYVAWIKAAGLDLHVDKIGNIVGVMAGETNEPPVLLGSHIDTVGTGGKYDGALGALGGLEVLQTLRDAGVKPRRAIGVIAFTNEEGARFQPDILGSCVWTGDMTLDEAYAVRDQDGLSIGDELRRIGYVGTAEPGFFKPSAYLELHIEQGPILDAEGGGIGAVTGVQAIAWREFTIDGEANHAGTTPMRYRHSASMAACRLAIEARALTRDSEGLVVNAGRMAFEPGNVNVIPRRAVMTLDIRNPSDTRLAAAESKIAAIISAIEAEEGVTITSKDLARFPAQPFDERLIGAVEGAAKSLGLPVRRMVSGAGHDAQMMATVTPTAMIFVPSVKGLSHTPLEFSRDDDVIAGCNVLLTAALELANA
jgi:beta-ureidopropionase / N-carbamoyl-L-amino-acid hydrolase